MVVYPRPCVTRTCNMLMSLGILEPQLEPGARCGDLRCVNRVNGELCSATLFCCSCLEYFLLVGYTLAM